MSASLSRGWRKATRDLLQAVAAITAAGGATALIDVITGNVEPEIGVILAFVFKVLFAFLQNWAETAGKISVLLPTPGVVTGSGPVLSPAAGTVDAVAETVGDTVGEVSGTVQDIAGGLIGEVVDVDNRED